ncbi:MAG: hypothetical protein ACTIIH_01825 [Brevibacterium sp.]|uniref:hypothetical protein n=1 Tax=Brevibacterium sp. TaxID=1701 RepID=UPI003F90D124
MALDQVWAVGGEAENPIEGARLSLYAALRGARGVILPNDMKVSALPVPGPFVRIVQGAATSPNDYLGIDGGAQQYAGREDSHTDFPVAATGSSGAQTKYLIWAVHDEQHEPGLTPDDPVNDPRGTYQWVSSINGLTFPHAPLVRLNQPANTATITKEMLTDIRELASPRKDFGQFSRPRVAGDNVGTTPNLVTRWSVDSKEYYGEFFPGGDNIPNVGQIYLPHWATHMNVSAKWMGLSMNTSANPRGRYWIEYGDEYRSHTWTGGRQYEFSTQQFGFSPTQTEWSLEDAVPIPKKLRGKNVDFCFKAGLNSGIPTDSVAMYSLGGISVRVDYTERAIDADTI